MSRIICVLGGEGFPVKVEQHDDLRVTFTADADVDADGSNGVFGKIAAYMWGDKGSDFLANGGMRMVNGEVRFSETWGRDIVLHDGDAPIVWPGGIIASKTAYVIKGADRNKPDAYLDSETVPYVVVSPLVRQRAKGVILGCFATARNKQNGKTVDCMVGDIGPRTKAGEISIEAARRLGLSPSPRHGGTDERIIEYTLHPGREANINGVQYHLMPA